MPIRALAFDMDGCICDSLVEVYNMSRIGFDLFTKDRSWNDAQVLDATLTLDSGALDPEFVRLRYLVRPAGNFYALWAHVSGRARCSDLSPAGFETWAEKTFGATCKEFETLFFRIRQLYMAKAQDKWLSLSPIYPTIKETWPKLGAYPKFIVTTKDAESTALILQKNALATEKRFTAGQFRRKVDALQEIARSQNLSPGEVLFLDDHPSYLEEADKEGFHVVHARWGYFHGETRFAGISQFSQLLSRLS